MPQRSKITTLCDYDHLMHAFSFCQSLVNIGWGLTDRHDTGDGGLFHRKTDLLQAEEEESIRMRHTSKAMSSLPMQFNLSQHDWAVKQANYFSICDIRTISFNQCNHNAGFSLQRGSVYAFSEDSCHTVWFNNLTFSIYSEWKMGQP